MREIRLLMTYSVFLFFILHIHGKFIDVNKLPILNVPFDDSVSLVINAAILFLL